MGGRDEVKAGAEAGVKAMVDVVGVAGEVVGVGVGAWAGTVDMAWRKFQCLRPGAKGKGKRAMDQGQLQWPGARGDYPVGLQTGDSAYTEKRTF